MPGNQVVAQVLYPSHAFFRCHCPSRWVSRSHSVRLAAMPTPGQAPPRPRPGIAPSG
jgi:hypothetical protein